MAIHSSFPSEASGGSSDYSDHTEYQVAEADDWTPPRPANDNNDRGHQTIVKSIAKGTWPDLSNVVTNAKFK